MNKIIKTETSFSTPLSIKGRNYSSLPTYRLVLEEKKRYGFGELMPLPFFGDHLTQEDIEDKLYEMAQFHLFLQETEEFFEAQVPLQRTLFSFKDQQDYVGSSLTSLKIKVGQNLQQEQEKIRSLFHKYPHISLRLDANNQFEDERQLALFLSAFTPEERKKRIEVIEDPFPGFWERESQDIPFAVDEKVDFYLEEDGPLHQLVLKTSQMNMTLEEIAQLVEHWPKKVVFSSAFDPEISLYLQTLYLTSEFSLEYPLAFDTFHSFQSRKIEKYFSLNDKENTLELSLWRPTNHDAEDFLRV